MKSIFTVLCVSILFSVTGQELSYTEKEVSVSKWIEGTLLLPDNAQEPPLAIIIAGSGPTNRDGNQNFMKNNALKKLAVALGQEGIASFRYDKRVVKQIRLGSVDKNTMFDDFVTDAKDVVAYFSSNPNFSKLIIIGHSQGSLVGMLASRTNVDALISLAGAGQNIGDVILNQINKTAPIFSEDAEKVVNKLKQGETTKDYPQALSSVFSSDLQPFMINWMKYDPSEVIKSLTVPLLILNGTKDLQVPIDEAKLLAKANDSANLVLLDNMNHVLFEIEGDDLENAKSYNEASRPISPPLISAIVNFISSF